MKKKTPTVKTKLKKVVKKVVATVREDSKLLKKEGKKIIRRAEKKWKETQPERARLERKAKKEASYIISRTIDLAKQLDTEIKKGMSAKKKKAKKSK
ncbi:MAG: hypothetical protein MUD00_02400 [Candidatus Pacebacteria bacterium]|jgi:hypothetical protein|nr:hypothetical protein [Candidatus Paceibacterota bacterium]